MEGKKNLYMLLCDFRSERMVLSPLERQGRQVSCDPEQVSKLLLLFSC